MPNGGVDNCAHCRFRSSPDRAWRVGDSLECTIRKVIIPHPAWTYCANIHTRSSIPVGPIFIAGLAEIGARPIGEDKMWIVAPAGATYVRIPCYEDTFPKLGTSGVCWVCSRTFENGISLSTDQEGVISFCCNKHYVDWWKKNNPDQKLRWEYDLHHPT
jgi:hypothetical protein